jgi:ribosomal protein S27E
LHPCPAIKCRGFDGNPTITNTPMCEHHTLKVRDTINNLPRLYLQIQGSMSAGSVTYDDGSRHTKGASAPLAINPQARAIQDDMLAVTRRADAVVRTLARLSPPPRRHPHHPHGRELVTLAARCKMLTEHYTTMLEGDVACGVEILRIAHATRSMLGLTRLVHRLKDPCPKCDHAALCREDGSSYVQCRVCGVAFNEDTYGLLARMTGDVA